MEQRIISIPIHNIFGFYCLYEHDSKELFSMIRPHILQKNTIVKLNFVAVRVVTSTFIDALFLELYKFAPKKDPLLYLNRMVLGPSSEIISKIYNMTMENFMMFHSFPDRRKKLYDCYRKYNDISDKKLLEELFSNVIDIEKINTPISNKVEKIDERKNIKNSKTGEKNAQI